MRIVDLLIFVFQVGQGKEVIDEIQSSGVLAVVYSMGLRRMGD